MNGNNGEIREDPPDQNESLFMTSLETLLFTQRLQEHQKISNNLDKPLASFLLGLVENISNFLENATIHNDSDDTSDNPNLDDLIPSVENGVLQINRAYFCRACIRNIRAKGKNLHDHFLSNEHLRNLKKFAQGNHSEALQKPDALKKKERVESLPRLLKEVEVKSKLPKKMRDFIATSNVTEFTANLIRQGNSMKVNGPQSRICRMLQKQLHIRFPSVRAYVFGSFVNGLAANGSDMDIFIDMENCFYNRPNKRKLKDFIYSVHRILSNVPHCWQNFEPVVHARTPILRAYCVSERIDCDLSFTNGLSTCNTNLIQYFLELQPVCLQITILVKFWAQRLQLGVNSYLIALMTIFYLQQENILPPVKVLQVRQ